MFRSSFRLHKQKLIHEKGLTSSLCWSLSSISQSMW